MFEITPMKVLEWVTMTSALATYPLGVRQKISIWPISITITLLNFFIYYNVDLYDRCFLAILSLVSSFYGWYQWRYGGKKKKPLRVSKLNLGTGFTLLLFAILGAFPIGYILQLMNSSYPYWGGIRTSFFLAALWTTSHKKLESYILWFFLNIISAVVCFYKGLYPFTGKYIIYIGFSVYGYYAWRRSYLSDLQKMSPHVFK